MSPRSRSTCAGAGISSLIQYVVIAEALLDC
jgi:hypothetical protein